MECVPTRDAFLFCPELETGLFSVVPRPSCGGKPVCSGNRNIVCAGVAMDNQNIAAVVPTSNNSDVRVIGVENKVPGLSVGHGNICAVVMLAGCAAALTEDDFSVGSVIEYPIHEAGAVEAEGAVGAGGHAAFGPYLLKLEHTGTVLLC